MAVLQDIRRGRWNQYTRGLHSNLPCIANVLNPRTSASGRASGHGMLIVLLHRTTTQACCRGYLGGEMAVASKSRGEAANPKPSNPAYGGFGGQVGELGA